MLHILLFIFKIILWIILGALGLLLLLVLLVLLCPIRYQVEGSSHGKKSALITAKVRYLCVSFRIHFEQSTGNLEQVIRVFGIRLGKEKKSKSKKKNVKPQKQSKKPIEPKPKKNTDIPLIEIDSLGVKSDIEGFEKEDSGVQEIDYQEFDVFDESLDRDVPKKEQKLFGRIKLFFMNLWEKGKAAYSFFLDHTPDKILERLEEKTEKLNKKIQKLKKFWYLSCTVKTRSYLKKYIKTFFGHIMPRKIKGVVHFGMAEPYKTSQVTGYLSLLPFVYKKGLKFVPNFQEKVLEFDLKLRGRITLGYLLRIALNINLWRTIRVAKKVLDK